MLTTRVYAMHYPEHFLGRIQSSLGSFLAGFHSSQATMLVLAPRRPMSEW